MVPMTTPDQAQPGVPADSADLVDDESRERALRAGLDDYELEDTDLALLDAEDLDLEDHEPEAPLPVLAVVGRPNVGKSTLVNRILGRREAVVEDKPGVTRDRVSYPAEWAGRRFTLVDTGGWEVDVVCLLIEANSTIGPGDRFVADLVQQVETPKILVVSKTDLAGRAAIGEQLAVATGELGEFDAYVPLSGLTGDGVDALGHVPTEGESARVNGYQFCAERVQGRRIVSVRVTPTAVDPEVE